MDSNTFRDILKEEFQTYHEKTLMPSFGRYTEDVVLPAIRANEQALQEEIRLGYGKTSVTMQ